MIAFLVRRISRWTTRVAALAVFGFAVGSEAQSLDLNTNGVSDVWEQIYGASLLDPKADADGDGVPNRSESIAGTNPFDANSAPRIANVAASTNEFRVSIPCALGKRYELQSLRPSGSGGWSNWVANTSIVARTGGVATLTATISNAPMFFRLAISDVDTDGDGLNDWEEYQLGLDPFDPVSNKQLDNMGQPIGDYAYAANKILAQNLCSITATDPACSQPDPGAPARDWGRFTVSRAGFPLNAITVNLALEGTGTGMATEGVDYGSLPRSLSLPAGVSSAAVTLFPLANPSRLTPAVVRLRLAPGAGYTLGPATNASVMVYPSATPEGTGLTGRYFTNSSWTYSNSANFNPANLKFTRTDPVVDFDWGMSTTQPLPNAGYYSVHWLGQVQPQYSETYHLDVVADDGFRLWVNDQLVLDRWLVGGPVEALATMDLQAGTRYNLKLEYYNAWGAGRVQLAWYSASQPKQVIPANRLYPAKGTPAPPVVTSPLTAIAFLGQPITYAVTAANTPLGFTARPLPPGLGFTNGVVSGVPTLAGDFQIMLTASNAAGACSAVLAFQVVDTGKAVTRELWSGVPGTNVSDIPVAAAPTSTTFLNSLASSTNYADNYGERIRGYLTAPATGNYYFWLSASDAAELWVSNDLEPVNKVRRAYVVPSGTAAQQWAVQPHQKSAWLALVAGQRYYVEILHKAGVGTNDNWAVGWLLDPTGTNSIPGGIVPGYLLSPYFQPPSSVIPGTLYSATMVPQAPVASTGVGTATLRVSANDTRAVLAYQVSGLSSPLTGRHIYCDPYLNNPGQLLFDVDVAHPQPDGSYLWIFGPTGTFTNAADIAAAISAGKIYMTMPSVNYPAGELSGHFSLAEGTQAFTPPPAPPTWTDDHADANAAARFLLQASFGPSPVEIARVQALGYAGWINQQFALPVSHHLTNVLLKASPDPAIGSPGELAINTWWKQSVTAPDQLRQRVAFALSEIMVVSRNSVLADRPVPLSAYYDTLLDQAFGNFRTLLKAATLSPAMGLFLDMLGNDKGDITRGTHPNENYAREIMQLFSTGLYRRWPDGTLAMDSSGNLVPTYNQDVVQGLASVFTGWNYYQTNQANGRLPLNFSPGANNTNPMVLVPSHHELGAKRLLDNVVTPPASGSQSDPASPSFDNYCLQDLEAAMDSIFYHDSVGPFICRQLIQRLVTSNPSRDYLYRVVQKFQDNGAGVRGDLAAVIQAILLDYEARSASLLTQPACGKQREPVLRVTAAARAFPPPTPPGGGAYQQNGDALITVTTTNAHGLEIGDLAYLAFTDTSGHAVPPSQTYIVSAVNDPHSFVVDAPGVWAGGYKQLSYRIDVTGQPYVVKPGFAVYLLVTSGGIASRVYQVQAVRDFWTFSLTTADGMADYGDCIYPAMFGGSFVQTIGNTLTVKTPMAHELTTNDSVYLDFPPLTGTSGTYRVITVPDQMHFVVTAASAGVQGAEGLTICPLAPPHLVRSGRVSVAFHTWNMGFTDLQGPSDLNQTPLNSPGVFNFFFPDFKFPGPLAAANLTTPEFQLTSDASVNAQANFLQAGILGDSRSTNSMSSYPNGDGAIQLDLAPWMTAAFTSDAGVPGLVDALSTLLVAGQLSPTAKSIIVNYVTNHAIFPYTAPTFEEIRERVRATVHLLISSPEFTIQR